MKKLFLIFIAIIFTGCALKKPNWNYAGDIKKYRFVKIANTQVKKVEEGSLMPVYGVGWVGYSEGESLDPKQAIAGELMKYGFLVADNVEGEDTLFVSYGEIGDNDFPEVAIQMIDTTTKKLIYSCSADGSSFTGTIDGLRQAISRCLSGLKKYFYSEKNTKSGSEAKNKKDDSIFLDAF